MTNIQLSANDWCAIVKLLEGGKIGDQLFVGLWRITAGGKVHAWVHRVDDNRCLFFPWHHHELPTDHVDTLCGSGRNFGLAEFNRVMHRTKRHYTADDISCRACQRQLAKKATS